jgi:hypothetical protein
VCMFCGCADQLDEFCFRRKRIERRHVEYARNSYRDEFTDFPPRSYSHVPPHFYSLASPHTSSCAFLQFSYGPNHHLYILVHERTILSLDALVTAHVLVMVIISHIGLVFLLEGSTPTLSQDTWMVDIFPVVVHVPLGQVVRCKGL